MLQSLLESYGWSPPLLKYLEVNDARIGKVMWLFCLIEGIFALQGKLASDVVWVPFLLRYLQELHELLRKGADPEWWKPSRLAFRILKILKTYRYIVTCIYSIYLHSHSVSCVLKCKPIGFGDCWSCFPLGVVGSSSCFTVCGNQTRTVWRWDRKELKKYSRQELDRS